VRASQTVPCPVATAARLMTSPKRRQNEGAASAPGTSSANAASSSLLIIGEGTAAR